MTNKACNLNFKQKINDYIFESVMISKIFEISWQPHDIKNKGHKY